MKKLLLSVLAALLITAGLQAQTWVEQAKTLPTPYPNLRNCHYGKSVAIDGDYAVVGSPGYDENKGSAYVLHNNGSTWEQVAKLTASDGAVGDYFGYSVSISDNNIVIGAYGKGIYGSRMGAAYVFSKPLSGGWSDATETAILKASDVSFYGEFGFSVSISGDNIVVGAHCDNDNGNKSGSAYIFTKPASGWISANETAKLTASDAATEDRFGSSVSISGDYIAVGAPYDDDNGNYSGSTYIFSKPTSGWADANETAKLTASDAATNDRFGSSVSISGDHIVVGSPYDDDKGNSSGSAYVFSKPTLGWTDTNETAKFTASGFHSNDYFGSSVGISNDIIVVSNLGYYGLGGTIHIGCAYVFSKPASGWADANENAKLTASNGSWYKSNYFGSSVGISADNIIVGAPCDVDNGSSGSAYVFSKPASGWVNSNENMKLLPNELLTTNRLDQYGTSVAVDGEYAVVGSSGFDSDKGCAYVLYYNGIVWEKLAILTASDREIDDYFGGSVSISGNNIVVGSYGDENKGGSAYVFSKPSSGWIDAEETAKLTASDGEQNDYFGFSVSISGDNIVVGAHGDNGYRTGSVYVFSKPASGWVNTNEIAKLTASDASNWDDFGRSVSISGDLIVVGTAGDDDNGSGSGSAYIFSKPASGWVNANENAKLTASDASEGDAFGSTVSISGDNIAVGAPGDDNNGNNSGSAYIFSKPASGWLNTNENAKLTASDAAINDRFGISVSISGDNIVVGTDGKPAYVFTKPASGWINANDTAELIPSDGYQYNSFFGHSISISGDNIVVGNRGADDNGGESGSAYIYKCLMPPQISTQPVSQDYICPSSQTYFGIEANNAETYQWQANTGNGFINLTNNAIYNGVNTDSLVILNASISMTDYLFRCVVSNAAGSVNSNDALLTVEDNTNPQITSTHNNQTVDADDNCEASLPDYTSDVVATDNCDNNLDIVQSPVAGTAISGATNIVTFTVTDDAGNFAEITFNVAVEDNTNPQITSTHNNQTVGADDNCEASLPDYTADVVATDNCDNNLDISQSPVAGTSISGATNTVTLTVTDDAGNFAETTFNVAVEDNTNPTIGCVDNQSINLEEGQTTYTVAGSEFDPVSTEDNCSIAETTNDFNNSSTLDGAELPTGTNTITWTAVDGAGNEAECSFDVTVIAYDGLTELQSAGISIYPNPTKDKLTIEFGNIEVSQLNISDLIGNTILQKTNVQQKECLNLSNLKTGIYLLHIKTAHLEYTTKIVKE